MMNAIESEINRKICDGIIEIESDLEETLRQIFEQAGGKIEPEKQAEVEQKTARTKQLLERLRSKYA